MKKVLSLLVVLSMLLSILPATVSAAHWADEDVAYLVENGAIAEDDAMLENLDTPITRSQMVKVIVALLEGDEPIEGKEYFTDITAEDTHIAKAAENGFVNGFGDGTFRPNNPITRQDFFTIVGRAYKLEGTATNEFTDNDAIADYAKPYVDALQSIGIVNGYGDGTVNPRGNITIAETLAVMHRTDEHVKANAPKEEEKPKPKPSGGGGGGYVGGSGHGTGVKVPAPRTRLSVELEEDFTGEYVGYLTIEVITDDYTRDSINKMMLLKTGSYYYPPASQYGTSFQNNMDKAEEFGQYIAEENGKYALPDFGTYALYIIGSYDTYIREFTVNPPISSENTAPELDVEVANEEGYSSYPCTFKVTATDDAGIARINYVKSTGLTSSIKPPIEMNYKIHVNGRQIVTGDTFTIDEDGTYYICAMDVNGNCTYRSFTATATIEDGIKVEMSDCEYSPTFEWNPGITYSFGTNTETNDPLEISIDIPTSTVPMPRGYFVVQNYLTTQDSSGPIDKKAQYSSELDLNLSNDIETLITQANDKETVCVIKDFFHFYDGGVVALLPIEEGAIKSTQNGVYYIYAQGTSGSLLDLTLVRFSVNNIKTASATFEVEHEEDTSSEYVAHVTATVDANPNAPVKQMFVVKSDYEPESAGAYREYTPNGKAQKIWDEVSESGDYIPVEESKFSVSEYGTYSLYMLDEYGNWGVSEVDVTPPYFPYATFSIELEDDFTGDYVAQVTANIITANNIPPKKTLVVVAGGLRPTGATGSFKPWEVAQEKNQYIAEVDGKFFVPDFGQYELYIIEEDDTVSEFAFDVIPPKSNDQESPKLDIEVVGEETLPVTFKTTVSDNSQIARLDYVKESNLGLGGTMLDENKNYMIYVNGRIPIVDNSFTISEYGNYIVCAMDIHGNYTFRYINVSSKKLSISDSCHVYSFDDFTPGIETSHGVLNEKLSGPIEIPLTPFDISPFTNPTVVDAGYFFMEECYLTEPLYTNLFPRRVYLKSRYAIDLSKDIDSLKQYESLCGGAGSLSILKNYYEATKDGSGIEIVPISKNEETTISLTKNGIYFAYAKDAEGNLAVVVLNLNHIKTASATFEVEHEDASSEYVAHVTATVDANPNAPVKQMFAVKSDYEPESAGTYREYTPNGKAQKIWDEVSISGEYIPVEDAKFSVSEYGTYSLYMLDEYGNWGVSEVTIEEPVPVPEPEPDSTEP